MMQEREQEGLVTLPQPIRTAILSIARHRGASLVAVATLAFLLSALTIFVLIASGLGNAASGLESKANLIADLNGRVSKSQAGSLERGIERRWPRTQVTYVSRRQALVQFRKAFAGNATMLSALEGNPLPASVQVKDANGSALDSIAAKLKRDPQVQRVIFNPNLTRKLFEITAIVTIGGSALVLGLAFLALVIVINTTHLTVEARRDEIEVMRLIGATHAFVRNPLILEGILLGLSGAIVAEVIGMGVFLPTVKGILGGASSFGAILPIDSGAGFLGVVVLFVAAVGAGIGALGSYVSVRRFAHV
jgi:cell division transport system permease protein